VQLALHVRLFVYRRRYVISANYSVVK